MYQKFGVVEDYWEQTHSQGIDKGRFEVTNNPADMYLFKVPTLRNVSMTPPYFHDGSVATLPEAVHVMGKVQLGKDLSKQDVDAIVSFLGSLTGRLPKNFETVPAASRGGISAQDRMNALGLRSAMLDAFGSHAVQEKPDVRALAAGC